MNPFLLAASLAVCAASATAEQVSSSSPPQPMCRVVGLQSHHRLYVTAPGQFSLLDLVHDAQDVETADSAAASGMANSKSSAKKRQYKTPATKLKSLIRGHASRAASAASNFDFAVMPDSGSPHLWIAGLDCDAPGCKSKRRLDVAGFSAQVQQQGDDSHHHRTMSRSISFGDGSSVDVDFFNFGKAEGGSSEKHDTDAARSVEIGAATSLSESFASLQADGVLGLSRKSNILQLYGQVGFCIGGACGVDLAAAPTTAKHNVTSWAGQLTLGHCGDLGTHLQWVPAVSGKGAFTDGQWRLSLLRVELVHTAKSRTAAISASVKQPPGVVAVRNDDNGIAVVDTGTAMIEMDVKTLKSLFAAGLRVNHDCSNANNGSLPDVRFVFDGRTAGHAKEPIAKVVTLTLHPADYLLRKNHGGQDICAPAFLPYAEPDSGSPQQPGGAFVVLGAQVMSSHFTVFSVEHGEEQVGFVRLGQ